MNLVNGQANQQPGPTVSVQGFADNQLNFIAGSSSELSISTWSLAEGRLTFALSNDLMAGVTRGSQNPYTLRFILRLSSVARAWC